MKTVRMILTLTILLAMTASVLAQEKKAPKRKGPRVGPIGQVVLRMGKIRSTVDALDLTAEQKEKIEAIRKEHGPKMGKALGKLKDILTEEQQKAIEEAGKKASEAGKEGRAMMAAISAAAKLTDEQKEEAAKLAEELRALNREMTKEIRGILTPEQKQKMKKALASKVRKPAKKKVKPAETK